MSLTATTIYNAVTLGTGATPTSPVTGGLLLPVATSTLAGNALSFNFILASGSTTPGPNPAINFKYAFSMTPYSGTTFLGVVSPATIPIRASSIINSINDITPGFSVPILGNYLYTWFDLNGPLNAPITVTVNATPVAICNTLYKI
jgi:hypothetical protein